MDEDERGRRAKYLPTGVIEAEHRCPEMQWTNGTACIVCSGNWWLYQDIMLDQRREEMVHQIPVQYCPHCGERLVAPCQRQGRVE